MIQYAQVDSVEDEELKGRDVDDGELDTKDDISMLEDENLDRSESDSINLQHYYQDLNTTQNELSSSLFHEVPITQSTLSISRDFTLNSNAWPEDHQAKQNSSMHQLIRDHLDQISREKMYFRSITDPAWMKEIRYLHEEWFPLTYPQAFYDKIYSGQFLCIGCFCEVRRGKKKKEVLLGLILARIQHGKEEINDIYEAKDTISGGWFGWVSQAVSCRERSGAYIATIGVVDECRRFGIGTMLLEEMEKQVLIEHTACEIIYLHVVDYNETALRFYERNKFSTLKRIKNHYVIFEKNYDGYLLYKDIKNAQRGRKQSTTASDDNESQKINEDDKSQQKQQLQQDSSWILGTLTYPIRVVYQKLIGSQ